MLMRLTTVLQNKIKRKNNLLMELNKKMGKL